MQAVRLRDRRVAASSPMLVTILGVVALAATARAGSPNPTIVAVSAGAGHSLALDADGNVWAWGNNAQGQLCDGTTVHRPRPVRVLDDVAAVSAGGHSLLLRRDGTVWACGGNSQGQLGDGTRTPSRATPAQVIDPGDPSGFLTGVTAVDGGNGFSLALRHDGTVRGWGANDFGQLGDGTSVGPRLAPVQVVDPTDGTTFLTGVQAISAGLSHAVALRSDGTVRSWGRSIAGQLGDGTSGPSPGFRAVPVRVIDRTDATGFLTGVIALDANQGSHTLALRSDGTVRAWGMNASGEIGDGTRSVRTTAVAVFAVPGLPPFTGVAAGQGHSLARGADGSVWTWGANRSGQLGDGTTTERWIPTRVLDAEDPAAFLGGVVAVSGGNSHSLALKKNGGVRAWGARDVGLLGDGSRALEPSPVPVVDVSDPSGFLTGIDGVSAAFGSSMALTSAGTVRAWGENRLGQLGDGTTTNRSAPVAVINLAQATAAAIGTNSALALDTVGTVRAWGTGTLLGTGGRLPSSTPVTVRNLSGIEQIAVGALQALAVKEGRVWAWGANQFGQLGDGTTTERLLPVPVKDAADPSGFLTGVVSVASANVSSLALRADGTVVGWGMNSSGQLCDGTSTHRSLPVRLSSADGVLDGVIAVAEGVGHSVLLREDGTVWTCGSGTSQLAARVEGLAGVVAIAAGGGFSVALTADGTVRAWGAGAVGQLGDGALTSSATPVQVADRGDASGFLTGVTGVAAGSSHAVAVKDDGTVVAWGMNHVGQLGDGSEPSALTPVRVRF